MVEPVHDGESVTGGVDGVRPDSGQLPLATTSRFAASFAWGLAAGVLAVLVILGVTAGTVAFLGFRTLNAADSGSSAPVVVSGVKAGGPWFSVGSDGKGKLQGWTDGSSGNGGPGQDLTGAVAYFDISNVDFVSGVMISHTVSMYVTRKTAITIGNQPYPKGTAGSPAEALFVQNQDGPTSTALDSHLLTVEFHRVGTYLVADSVSASLEVQQSPLDY